MYIAIFMILMTAIYQVAQNMSYWTKCNFSATDRGFFKSKLKDLQGKDFQQFLNNGQSIVTFNVQRR